MKAIPFLSPNTSSSKNLRRKEVSKTLVATPSVLIEGKVLAIHMPNSHKVRVANNKPIQLRTGGENSSLLTKFSYRAPGYNLDRNHEFIGPRKLVTMFRGLDPSISFAGYSRIDIRRREIGFLNCWISHNYCGPLIPYTWHPQMGNDVMTLEGFTNLHVVSRIHPLCRSYLVPSSLLGSMRRTKHMYKSVHD